MKISFLIITALSLLFFACDEVDEATTIDLETTLEVEIPIATVDPSMVKTKSTVELAEFIFGGTEIISLSEDEDLVEYLDNIKELQLKKGAKLEISGVNSGNEVHDLNFVWGYCETQNGEYTEQSPVALSGGVIDIATNTMSYSLDDHLPEMFEFLEDHPWHYYKIRLSGTSNFVPDSPVRFLIPIVLKVAPLEEE